MAGGKRKRGGRKAKKAKKATPLNSNSKQFPAHLVHHILSLALDQGGHLNRTVSDKEAARAWHLMKIAIRADWDPSTHPERIKGLDILDAGLPLALTAELLYHMGALNHNRLARIANANNVRVTQALADHLARHLVADTARYPVWKGGAAPTDIKLASDLFTCQGLTLAIAAHVSARQRICAANGSPIRLYLYGSLQPALGSAADPEARAALVRTMCAFKALVIEYDASLTDAELIEMARNVTSLTFLAHNIIIPDETLSTMAAAPNLEYLSLHCHHRDVHLVIGAPGVTQVSDANPGSHQSGFDIIKGASASEKTVHIFPSSSFSGKQWISAMVLAAASQPALRRMVVKANHVEDLVALAPIQCGLWITMVTAGASCGFAFDKQGTLQALCALKTMQVLDASKQFYMMDALAVTRLLDHVECLEAISLPLPHVYHQCVKDDADGVAKYTKVHHAMESRGWIRQTMLRDPFNPWRDPALVNVWIKADSKIVWHHSIYD